MGGDKILKITIPKETKEDILYKIKKYIEKPTGFFHIVSLNPENLVVAGENKEFKKVLVTAQIKLIDGIGIVLASRLLGIKIGERVTGVEFMEDLVRLATERRLRVLLIGGRGNLADSLARCYQKKYREAKFKGIEGIRNIKNPLRSEEKKIFTIVSDFKPHLIFVAFGSPWQELWIKRHRNQFQNCIVMGVGGAFDFLAGEVPRAPIIIRRLGFEWLFRLVVQPWRWRRQLRLVWFSLLISLGFLVNLVHKKKITFMNFNKKRFKNLVCK